jgi:hypothetical protein
VEREITGKFFGFWNLIGIFSGRYGFEEFSHSKAVLVRGFFGDGLAR